MLGTQPEEEGALTPLTPLTPQPSFFADALAALAGTASADAGGGGGLQGLGPGLGLSVGLGSVGAATLPPAPSLFSEALAAMASAATPGGADTPPALPPQAPPLPFACHFAPEGLLWPGALQRQCCSASWLLACRVPGRSACKREAVNSSGGKPSRQSQSSIVQSAGACTPFCRVACHPPLAACKVFL